MTDSTGTGDVERSLRLMWRAALPQRQTRGPRPALTVDMIVTTAVARADRGGLDALSMRGLADELGVGVMSLYNHVPSKAELIDVMADQVLGELYPGDDVPGHSWRERLETVARATWDLCLRHPWLVEISTIRPPLGPGACRRYELELRAVDGEGFSDLDMDSAVALVAEHALASARLALAARRVAAQTGMSDADWWAVAAPILATVVAEDAYPVADRVGPVAGATHQAATSPDYAFEFGLARILDGLALLRRP